MAKHQVRYQIAGLTLAVNLPETLQPGEVLPSFEPFLVNEPVSEQICVVELSYGRLSPDENGGKLLSDVSGVWTDRFRFYEQAQYYLTSIASGDEESMFTMKSSKDFSSCLIYMSGAGQVCEVLSWMIMVAFGQACLLHKAILIHASVVECGGKGFAFLGKSGTGKSTHSRLWLKHIEGAVLLNDDNPAIRVEDEGEVFIYGTPWSGKTACYNNRRASLQAFVRLKQAPFNKMLMKSGMEALVCVLPSCTAIRWNKQLFTRMTDTVEAVLGQLQVAELECLPNQEAAVLCYQEVNRN